jgi:hypothetical protein
MATITGYPTNTEILLIQNTLYYGQSFFVMLLNDVRSVFPFTVNDGTDVFTATGHDYILNTPIQFAVDGGGILPAPLLASTTYYVRDVAPNTFKLSATVGGAAIDITTTGTGTFSVTDIALAPNLGTVALFERKELSNYQGLTVRPPVTLDAAPVVNATAIAITKSIQLNNVAGAGDLTFNKFLLIRGGSSAIGDTTGTVSTLAILLSDIVVLAGQSDTLTVGVTRSLPI